MALAPMRDWERVFSDWSTGPGEQERERCSRAVNGIRNAIDAHNGLAGRNLVVREQGSYRNRTNVRQDSDVDVAVLYRGTVVARYEEGLTSAHSGLAGPPDYSFSSLKRDVHQAMIERFGAHNVQRGNKAIDVNENTYHVDADATPCIEYRYYYRNIFGTVSFHEGIALFADDTGELHFSYPDQQYSNGVAKNDNTGRRFKKVVRIVKKLRYEMEESGIASAEIIPSFLVESLIWNAPNSLFQRDALKASVMDVLSYLWNQTQADASCDSWTEENGIKYLFRPTQSWTRIQANRFLLDAWGYVNGR